MKTAGKVERPEMMPEVVPHYAYESSRVPESIRVSFADGSTAVYQLDVKMPPPQFTESIRIIRKWRTGYKAEVRGK